MPGILGVRVAAPGRPDHAFLDDEPSDTHRGRPPPTRVAAGKRYDPSSADGEWRWTTCPGRATSVRPGRARRDATPLAGLPTESEPQSFAGFFDRSMRITPVRWPRLSRVAESPGVTESRLRVSKMPAGRWDGRQRPNHIPSVRRSATATEVTVRRDQFSSE